MQMQVRLQCSQGARGTCSIYTGNSNGKYNQNIEKKGATHSSSKQTSLTQTATQTGTQTATQWGGAGRLTGMSIDWNIDNGQAVAETNFRFWLQIKHVPQKGREREREAWAGLGLELMRIDAGGVCETCKNIFICSRLRIRSNWSIWPEPQHQPQSRSRHKSSSSSSSQLQHKLRRQSERERERQSEGDSSHFIPVSRKAMRLRFLCFQLQSTYIHSHGLPFSQNYSQICCYKKLISFFLEIKRKFHFNNTQKITVV